jgi:uncharacterized protein
MTKMLKLPLIPLVFLMSGGFGSQKIVPQQPIGQPADERAAQAVLPKSQSPVWQKFLQSKVSYNKRTGLYSIAVTPDVKALAGRSITVNGFVMPLDGSDHTSHFLLTRNTPVCMFCPPGEPNEVVEVSAPHPILWTDKIVTVTGPLSLINNGEKGMFFKIAANAVR